jgi:broad specificity phosphatase PhoE
VIGLHVGLTPVVNGLFYEIERPSKFFGTSHFSLETLWYIFLSVLHRKNSSWHYTDGENFAEVSLRARRALAYIESLRSTHKTVVIVSHTIFINIIVSYMCQSTLLGLFDMLRTFIHLERMKNGAVIHVEYTGTSGKNTCSWRVVSAV